MQGNEKRDRRRDNVRSKILEDDMEQLLGEFETINSAANAKLDMIEDQYSQDDIGIVDTGATSGVAALKDAEKWIPREKYQKRFLYYPTETQ